MLTVKMAYFEKQIAYLLSEGYKFYSVEEIIILSTSKSNISKKAVTLTFDDAYLNNMTYLLPVLKKYNLTACIFLPVSYIGKTNIWDGGSDSIMDYGELKACQPYFEYGLHSYSHSNLTSLSIADYEDDLAKSQVELTNQGLSFLPALAYPFGQYPKQINKLNEVKETMFKGGLKLAFRIGNEVNNWPLKDPFLIKRIDIQGTDSFWAFKTKVKKGKVKMF